VQGLVPEPGRFTEDRVFENGVFDLGVLVDDAVPDDGATDLSPGANGDIGADNRILDYRRIIDVDRRHKHDPGPLLRVVPRAQKIAVGREQGVGCTAVQPVLDVERPQPLPLLDHSCRASVS